MRVPLLLVPFLATTALAGMALAQSAPAPAPSGKPQLGAFGLDESGMDRSIQPGDDFDQFMNGAWRARTEIPADKPGYGGFFALQDLSLERTRGILEEAQAQPGSKIGDFYASFMDEAAADAKGLKPIQPYMDQIAAAPTREALASVIGTLQADGVTGPFGIGVDQDDKAPDTYIVGLRQAGLGLPDRDYYLAQDADKAKARAGYQALLVKLLTMRGVAPAEAETRAAAVLAFETAIATGHWTRAQSREAEKTYNKWLPADFATRAPGFPWTQYLAASGVAGQSAYLVAQPSAFAAEAKAYAETPLPVLKDWYQLRTELSFASFLTKDLYDSTFAFFSTQLSGVPQQQPRWKRGVNLVSAQMGEAVGPIYVARYFPPEAKAQIDLLVRNIIAAMGQRLNKLAWMAPETKAKAQEKLAAFRPKIGYPDTWRDYSTLTIARDDLVGNVARARAFEYRRSLNKLGKPIDRNEWGMTPMTINAYAAPTLNQIVFPAAILQAPFFDPKADSAVNYGAIGAVIGHELSHHFDDQGRKYDKTGALADWWTPGDIARFKTLSDRLVAQYDAYEPFPGVHVNGRLTLGENIADLAGLTVAYDAYHASLGGKPAPVIGGLTGDQRFYMGFGQVWRSKYRDAYRRQLLTIDSHGPDALRIWEVRNLDPWYAAFAVKPGQKMYLAPADRVRIW